MSDDDWPDWPPVDTSRCQMDFYAARAEHRCPMCLETEGVLHGSFAMFCPRCGAMDNP